MRRPTNRFALTILAATAFLALFALPATAKSSDAGGAALKGFDPVAYFTEGRAVAGRDDLTVRHNGAEYRFASADNRRMFKKSPKRYLPEFDGFCAYGAAKGAIFPADPEVFEVVDGKLYLNYDAEVQTTWREDIPGNIAKGNANWPELRKEAAEQKSE